MQIRLKERWQAWVEVWTAIRACHAGRNEKLEVRRTGQVWDVGARQYRERLEFRAADNPGWEGYNRSRNLLATKVPRLSKTLEKLKWI